MLKQVLSKNLKSDGQYRPLRTISIIILTLLILLVGSATFPDDALAQSALDSKTLDVISSAVFEVVVPKPTKDSLSYERILPLDLIPYSIRTDKYYPIGTAFAISPTEFVSAAHVMSLGLESQFGQVSLRDKDGKVYNIDRIEKYSEKKDFVIFLLKEKTAKLFLKLNPNPQINQRVFAVGNALGEGIVIRDGLYTSNTPEQDKGEWKWIRFSAAASPGNSGGPLLDTDGRVIGIVSRKSPNENLNYALPIKEALDAKANVATVYKKMGYLLDNSDLSKMGISQKETDLPKSYQSLNRELIEVSDLSFYNLLKSLFNENRNNIFPNGKGSIGLLHKTYDTVFPNLIIKGDDGNWDAPTPKEIKEADLSKNGYIRYGNLARTLFLYVQKPDDVALEKLYQDSKLFMDLILKGVSLHRNIGSEKIKITSFGNSYEDYIFNDSYGRKWFVKTWLLEYSDEKVVTFSLPVPGGYMTMARIGQTWTIDHGDIADLKILTNFIYVSYSGTLRQWREFLKMKNYLPTAFSCIEVSFDYGKRFHYKSNRISFSYPSEVMSISEKSYMKLMFGYFKGKERTEWDVVAISVGEDKNTSTSFRVERMMRPVQELGERYQSHWENVAKQKFPFNRSAYYKDKSTKIAAVPDNSNAKFSPILHAVEYEKEGTVDQKEMEEKLVTFINNLSIYEKGEVDDFGYKQRKDAYHDKGEYYQALYDMDRLPSMNPQFADGHILRGEIYKDKKDYDRAMEDYGKAAELSPQSVKTYFGKDFAALLYGIKGQFKEAQEEINKVLKSDPLYTSAETILKVTEDAMEQKVKRESSLHLFKGMAFGDMGLRDEAFAAYSKAIGNDPEYAVSYDIRGLARILGGDADNAILDYSKAVELNPRDIVAYNRRGVAYKVKKEYDKAIADFDKALEVNPSYVKALKNRGNIYHFKGEYDRAIEDYNNALHLYPTFIDATYDRGLSWHAKTKYDQAIDDFDKVILMDVGHIDAYIGRGSAYHAKGEYDVAILNYNKAIEINPRNAMAYFDRGLAYQQKKEFDLAFSDYTRAIEIRPDYSDAYISRAGIHREKKEYEKAIADYNKAIETNPKNELALYNRGHVHRDRKDWESAITDYTKAIELNPKYALAYYSRGAIYRDRKEFDLALSDYEKVIQINPGFSEAYISRGNLYQAKGEIDRAITDYNKAIEIDSKNSQAYSNRGLAYLNRKEFDRALSDYNKAIELNPADVNAYNNRGTIYQGSKNYDKAISDFTKAIEVDPKHDASYYNRGISYYFKGDLDRAIADYTKAIEINPRKAEAYNNRGTAYNDQGHLDKAIADYTKVIELNPDKAEAYIGRGAIHATKGMFQHAFSDLNKALEIDPNNGRAYDQRGTAHGRKGDYDLAISDFNKALEIDPRNADVYNNRGFTFKSKGQLDLAIRDFDQCIQINPKHALAYINRGNTYAMKKDEAKACLDWKHACDLGSCGSYDHAKAAGDCKGN